MPLSTRIAAQPGLVKCGAGCATTWAQHVHVQSVCSPFLSWAPAPAQQQPASGTRAAGGRAGCAHHLVFLLIEVIDVLARQRLPRVRLNFAAPGKQARARAAGRGALSGAVDCSRGAARRRCARSGACGAGTQACTFWLCRLASPAASAYPTRHKSAKTRTHARAQPHKRAPTPHLCSSASSLITSSVLSRP